MSIKRGFSLIELLVTLTIIGIAAALALPALYKNSQNAANAVKLKSCIEKLEYAFTTMIATEGVNNIFETTAWRIGPVNATSDNKAEFLNAIERYVSTVGIQEGENPVQTLYGENKIYALNNNGSRGSYVGHFNNCLPVIMKDGSVAFIRTFEKKQNGVAEDGSLFNQRDAFKKGTSLNGNPGDIFIDVNGAKAPNTIGRDLFAFYIGTDGTLYPYGSKDTIAYHNENETSSNYWKVGCTDSLKENSGWQCTARLIEEGYKMNY